MQKENSTLLNVTVYSQEIEIKITNYIKILNLTYNTCEINNNIFIQNSYPQCVWCTSGTLLLWSILKTLRAQQNLQRFLLKKLTLYTAMI